MLRVLRQTARATRSVVAPCILLLAAVAHAQAPPPAGPDPLAAARTLFAQALDEEEAGHFADALEKFERVRAVRDTAPIEYRIGTCYEGLQQPAPAFRAYVAAERLGAIDPQGLDVSRAATERLDALAKEVARLTLTLPTPAPAGAEVRVDDAVVETATPMALAPGRHVVSATAAGAVPFRSEIALAGGAQVSLTVVLEPAVSRPSEAPAPKASDSRAAAGWLAIGGGATLVILSAILLVARHDDIADLNQACPGGMCSSRVDESSLESTRHRALVYGPVGVASGVAGVALAAVGVYLIAGAHRSATAGQTLAIVPMVAGGGAGLALTGAVR